jgi:hypothetical protein
MRPEPVESVIDSATANPARSLIRLPYAHFTTESFMQKKTKTNPAWGPRRKRGGARPNSGRPPKVDKDKWVEANVRLRRDTVERLREGAGSPLFGKFLQEHLDRHPVPTREEYLRLQTRRMRIPLSPKEREAREWAKFSPSERFQLSLLKNPKKMNDPAFVAKLRAKRDREEAKLAKAQGMPVSQMFPRPHDLAGKAVSR